MITFRLFGIKIKIEFLFVAVVTIFLLVDKSGIGVMGLIACFMHEIGHLLMFCIVGSKPTKLEFDAIGIRLTKSPTALSYPKEMLVQIAGCLVNFATFGFLYYYTKSINSVGVFAVTHLILGIFNILPIKTFDGGKILEITLLRSLSCRATSVICTIVEILIIGVMLVISIIMLFENPTSFTLVVITCYLALTALVKLNRS